MTPGMSNNTKDGRIYYALSSEIWYEVNGEEYSASISVHRKLTKYRIEIYLGGGCDYDSPAYGRIRQAVTRSISLAPEAMRIAAREAVTAITEVRGKIIRPWSVVKGTATKSVLKSPWEEAREENKDPDKYPTVEDEEFPGIKLPTTSYVVVDAPAQSPRVQAVMDAFTKK